MSRPKILMLTHRIPYPPDRGDRIRSLNVLQQFSKRWDVWLACTNDEPIEKQQLDYLRSVCVDVSTATCMGMSRWLRAVRSAASGRSLTEGLFANEGLKTQVDAWAHEINFDAVFCYCSSMFPYVDSLPSKTPMIVDLIDVDSQKWAAYQQKCRSWKRAVYALESKRVRTLEQAASERASHVTLVSDDEVDAFQQYVDDASSSVAIGNGVDVDYFQPTLVASSDDVPTLAFVGVLDYAPNVEGIAWFVKNVLPLIREVTPVRLSIVGRRANAEVKRLAQHDDVSVHSDVPDVREYLHRADVVIAPLRLARGVQNKVLEAMACGRPVVATSAAASGIEAVNGEELFVTDEAESFADRVIGLLSDDEQRKQVGAAARRLVEARYGWSARLAPMVQLMSNMISQSEPEALVL